VKPLETERLIIREYHESDLSEYHELLSDKQNMYFLDDITTNSLEESRESLKNAVHMNNSGKARRFCITLKERGNDKLIGGVGYEISAITPLGKIADPMGWFIMPEFQNNGYVTEAARRVLDYAFSQDDCIRVVTGCYADNLPTQKVMDKVGFRKEGERFKTHFHDGKMKDRLEYALNKDEWEIKKETVNITIIPAILDDAASLTAIQKQAFEIYQDEASPYLRESSELKHQIENRTRDIYKIVADDLLCGGIAVCNNGDGEYYLNRIYILPQLQGKSVGRKAIELCEKKYPDAKRWTVDFPVDQLANKKCYEYSGYYDTGLRETISDKLILAYYEKAVNGIFRIQQTQLDNATDIIRTSFSTVASEFGLTEQNCPNHTSFITADKLQGHFESDWMMYGLYNDERLVGYISLSNESAGVYELHNLSVLPEYRHKRCGRQLLDFCKENVIKMSGKKITISIIEENTVLKNWYAANGFAHTGTKTFAHLPFTVGFMEWEGL